MGDLIIDDISMRFDLPDGGAVQALKNVSLELKKGELMSVLGPSGCGKTTLLNIVAGFLAPTEGQIILNEHRVTGPDAERGMVFQQGALFEWMNVRKNISFGRTWPESHQRKRRNKSIICCPLWGCRNSVTRWSTNCQAACSSAWH